MAPFILEGFASATAHYMKIFWKNFNHVFFYKESFAYSPLYTENIGGRKYENIQSRLFAAKLFWG